MIPFQNSYARLPDRFFARVEPTAVSKPRLIKVNRALAEELGIDPEALASPAGVAALAGNVVPPGAEPIAMAYAGHQFGGFVPQLGDGRAILLGEVVDRMGRRRDLHLKGSGPTPFSRRGDGRAALGPVLREYLVSEAMHALGVPSTRTLAAVTTGDKVYREEILPGAVLTRVAASHIRVGTFEYFAAREDTDGVRLLADHVIARHYPACADRPDRYRALLQSVIAAQARLIAQWMLLGFIHGVMNTDNMSIAGETIDYGPCAFMDEYDPATVYSAIDRNGRYAYANQPAIGQWNLTRLAECLVPLLHDETEAAVEIAKEALGEYGPAFEAAYRSGLRRKMGLQDELEGDVELARDLLNAMAAQGADFTLTFRDLGQAVLGPDQTVAVRQHFKDPSAFDAWLPRWQERLAREPREPSDRIAAMNAVNPAFIPRNHRVEAVIQAAVERDDFAPFEELLAVITRPYEDQPEHAAYLRPPEEHERVHQTFCGT
jgi:serine/tyrosine/threonine adenylyltransferase